MRHLACWLLILAVSACAAPAQQADLSVATVRAEGRYGSALGTVVSVAPGIVVTARHVIDSAAPWERVAITRGDGVTVEAALLARSPTIDLAVLRVPVGFLAPRILARTTPARGVRVHADGTRDGAIHRVSGDVEVAPFRLAGYGPGFVADLAAVPGFSGGPVIDAEGRLVGLTAAQIIGPVPAAPLVAGGVIRPGQVFVLGAPAIVAELRRLLLERVPCSAGAAHACGDGAPAGIAAGAPEMAPAAVRPVTSRCGGCPRTPESR